MDIKLALMCGIDIPIPELQVKIHQPTIKEIALIGEEDFFMALQFLTFDKSSLSEEDKSSSFEINNFQIFMTMIKEAELKDKKKSVILLLQLLFPAYQVMFSPQSIIFTKEDGSFLIDESTFEIFQSYIKEMFGLNSDSAKEQTFNPGNDAAKKIADKLMRGRKRVAAQKQGENGGSFFGRYVSILTIGLNSMSLKDLINSTVYQIYDLIERYGLYLAWDLDIKSRLAGGKPDSLPDDWKKNIH